MALGNDFATKRVGPFELLISRDWEGLGVTHGMTGVSLGLNKETQAQKLVELADAMKVKEITVLKQIHGGKVIQLGARGEVLEGDALFGVRQPKALKGVGVISADCVPILFWNEQVFGAIHAGWRGLAAGIIPNTFAAAKSEAGRGDFEVLIGPCAGGSSYEVGPEVPKEIGTSAVCVSKKGRTFLDLVSTAKKQIAKSGIKARVTAIDICTISEPAFHSYRREGIGCGRNLSFIIG